MPYVILNGSERANHLYYYTSKVVQVQPVEPPQSLFNSLGVSRTGTAHFACKLCTRPRRVFYGLPLHNERENFSCLNAIRYPERERTCKSPLLLYIEGCSASAGRASPESVQFVRGQQNGYCPFRLQTLNPTSADILRPSAPK